MTNICDKHWNDFCKELEEMIDAADDAWEAEQRGSVNKRNNIKESRYEPAKDKMKEHLDLYIDQKIKDFVIRNTNAKLTIFDDFYIGDKNG